MIKFPFFDRHKNDAGDTHDTKGPESSDNEPSKKTPEGSASIVSADSVELRTCDHSSIAFKSTDAAARLNSLIPVAANAANAAGQWNQAIVRFPKGASWNDLIGRKTPGWEEWKQLGILRDGKFQPQAAIRQARLQPVVIANLALQGAALAVGQAYMTEIDERLRGIQSGTAAIQKEMQLEREAKLEARLEKLLEYVTLYGEIADNPEKRQAVLTGLELIGVDALETWKFQVKSMNELGTKLKNNKLMDDGEVKSCLDEFRSRESDAANAIMLCIMAERTSMQYEQDFGTKRIAREREKLAKRREAYDEARGKVQKLLREQVSHVKSGPLDHLAIPAPEDDGYELQNPLADALHAITANVPRFAPLALYEEGKSKPKRRGAITLRKYPLQAAWTRSARHWTRSLTKLTSSATEPTPCS
jgi:hypothetical protein